MNVLYYYLGTSTHIIAACYVTVDAKTSLVIYGKIVNGYFPPHL